MVTPQAPATRAAARAADDEEDPSMPAGAASPAAAAGGAGSSHYAGSGSGSGSLEPPDWVRPEVALEIPILHGNKISVGLIHAARALSHERLLQVRRQ